MSNIIYNYIIRIYNIQYIIIVVRCCKSDSYPTGKHLPGRSKHRCSKLNVPLQAAREDFQRKPLLGNKDVDIFDGARGGGATSFLYPLLATQFESEYLGF